MGAVDPNDDALRRFVVFCYAYDPERHERRHQVMAAFDEQEEFECHFRALADDFRRRRLTGEDLDPRLHVTGVVREPGDRRRSQVGHLIRRTIEHGASLPAHLVAALNLPRNHAVARAFREPG